MLEGYFDDKFATYNLVEPPEGYVIDKHTLNTQIEDNLINPISLYYLNKVDISELPKTLEIKMPKIPKASINNNNYENTNLVSSKGTELFEENYNKAALEDSAVSKHRNLLTKLAKIESSYNSRAYNPAGAYGYFLLFEKGKVRNVSNYSGTNTNEFLNNPILLIKAASRLADANEKQLTKSRLEKGKAAGLNKDDMMAIMWFSGAGGLDAFLEGNYRSDGTTNTLQYLRKFRNA